MSPFDILPPREVSRKIHNVVLCQPHARRIQNAGSMCTFRSSAPLPTTTNQHVEIIRVRALGSHSVRQPQDLELRLRYRAEYSDASSCIGTAADWDIGHGTSAQNPRIPRCIPHVIMHGEPSRYGPVDPSDRGEGFGQTHAVLKYE